MPTIEIPPSQWTSFLDDLSRTHVDEPVSVDILREDIGAQTEIHHLPLGGIGADLKGPSASIAISAGPGPGESISHVIADPTALRLLRADSGEDEVLEIEAADRSRTLVYFEGGAWPTEPARSA
ncbi:MAG TPA: DUF5335 family protein [Kofleriaceae bacterium]|nr:DUF5335 family protein [Kofleriaceae bacterium]